MNFAVMICTHGRPDRQLTFETLRKSGYTGKIILIVDDEDKSKSDYVHRYNNDVVVFNKQRYIDKSDTGTNEDQRKCILYAKNFCEDYAKELNFDAFVIADDDIRKFRYRYIENDKLKGLDVKDLDSAINLYIEFMLNNDITATGFGITQFYFTGLHTFDNDNMQKYRIPYNFVFRNPKFDVNWMSWFGEDIITAVHYNKVGQVWIALPFVHQEIVALATADGGMKDTYDSNSDVRLAMQNVMYLPTELKAYRYKDKYMASIVRDKAFPKLISSSFQLRN